jgi:hypothetical protein
MRLMIIESVSAIKGAAVSISTVQSADTCRLLVSSLHMIMAASTTVSGLSTCDARLRRDWTLETIA